MAVYCRKFDVTSTRCGRSPVAAASVATEAICDGRAKEVDVKSLEEGYRACADRKSAI